MDTGTPKRRWMLYAYIFLCIAIGLGGPMTIFRSGRPLTAFAFFVGSIIIFIMFGRNDPGTPGRSKGPTGI